MLFLVVGLGLWITAGGPKLPPDTDAVIDDVMKGELPELIAGSTGTAVSDGISIWYESIEPHRVPEGTVLLIIGMGGSALDWPRSFIESFAQAGYRVVRYDQRDTGMSDRLGKRDNKNPYTIADMARDAWTVLESLNIEHVHVVGLSMGGMIAQEIAIRHPNNVQSLTLMMTSGNAADPGLPSMSSAYFFRSIITGLLLLKYRIAGGEKNLVKERIAKMVVAVGPENVDIREVAEMVLYDLRKRRGVSISGVIQHQKAVSASPPRYDELEALTAPALIIHGTEDPIMPIAHGRKLAETIPKAQALWLEGVGHVFPFPDMEKVAGKILAHLASSGLPEPD